MAEIVAHQPLDLLLRLGARVAERLGGLLLQLVAEHVLVASGHQVQHRADAKEIILRFLETRRLDRTTREQRRVGQARNRPRRPQVAQRPGRFLHIRLELIQRVVEARMPRVDERDERRHDVGVRRGLMERHREPLEQRPIAGQRPRVDQRKQELGVVGLEGGKIGELADLLSDDDAEVPQGVEETVQEPFIGGTNRALKENEQVDIRPQTQLTAAVPAERDGGDRLRGRRRRFEQLTQQRVDPRRVSPERGASAKAAGRRVAEFLPRQFQRARGRGRRWAVHLFKRPGLGIRHRAAVSSAIPYTGSGPTSLPTV